MKCYRAEAAGNTFLIIYNGVDPAKPLAYLDTLRRENRWDFDSALMVSDNGTELEVTVFERDRSISASCGNGLRAVGRVLDLLGKDRTVKVGDERVRIRRVSDEVYRVPMGKVTRCGTFRHPQAKTELPIYLVQGEPHIVMQVSQINVGDVERLGQPVVPYANFTMVRYRGQYRLHALTYERGVNRVTLSCGTGACAAVQACRDSGREVVNNVKVHMLYDEPLIVAGDHNNLVLEGPVRVTEEVLDAFLDW